MFTLLPTVNSFSEGGIPVEDFENGRSPSTPVKSVVSSSSTGLSPSPLKPSQKPNRMDEVCVCVHMSFMHTCCIAPQSVCCMYVCCYCVMCHYWHC